jgi:hypothetical protein
MSKAEPPHHSSKIARSLARILRGTLRSVGAISAFETNAMLGDLSAQLLAQSYDKIVEHHPNPLNRCGRKVFSNGDEDGITFEIIRRIGIECGVFAEFGVGDGLENNTIFLASLGWKGFWVGGQELAFSPVPIISGARSTDFAFLREFIDRTNILSLAYRGLEAIAEIGIDVLSLDLDGNDIYLLEELLSGGILPKVFIVEYNAKFPPPIRWKIEYDPLHRWSFDDYFGASLMVVCDLFEKHGYFLVCCNSATGSNAFFVRAEYCNAFRDVPSDVNVLWAPPRYNRGKYGHPVSPKTVALIMKNIGNVRTVCFKSK